MLYEDEHILAVDKPAGLAIHPGSGITGDTLVDQVRAYLLRQGLVVPEGEFRPSPAHRLDRETSGVVVVAKTRQAMVRLTEIFTAGEAEKTYLALAKGRFQREQGSIDLRLAERQQTYASKQQRGFLLLAGHHGGGFAFEVEMIAVCLREGWPIDWVPIRTIYAGEPSHIRPLAHLQSFIRIVRKARRTVRLPLP